MLCNKTLRFTALVLMIQVALPGCRAIGRLRSESRRQSENEKLRKETEQRHALYSLASATLSPGQALRLNGPFDSGIKPADIECRFTGAANRVAATEATATYIMCVVPADAKTGQLEVNLHNKPHWAGPITISPNAGAPSATP